MSFRIERGEELTAALRRIAAEETNLALTELKRKNPDHSIHNARKAIKRLRALLRCLHPVLPGEFFKCEDETLSRAGRKISPARDIHVQLATLKEFQVENPGMGNRVLRELLWRQKSIMKEIPKMKSDARELIEAFSKRIKTWPLKKATRPCLAAGIKKIYKHGRTRLKKTQKTPSPDNLHDWRKEVKALAHALELLERLLPRKFSKCMSACKKLGDKLGSDHDLFMLSLLLRSAGQAGTGPDGRTLLHQISRKRQKLQSKSFKAGKVIYRRKADDFAKRLERHFD